MIRSAVHTASGIAVLLCASSALSNTAEPVLTEPVLSTANLMGTAAGLGLVLVLILGLGWMVRRFGRFSGLAQGAVQVLGGVSLGPREKAVLLSVQGIRLLVGVAPGSIRTLHVIGKSAPSDQVDDKADTQFAKTFSRVKPTGNKS